jgi:phosphoglycolate phosphatase
VPQLLDFLAQSGIPWGIVTNKYEALTMPILRAANLIGKTTCVVCGDTLRSSKPDPAPVIHACNVLNVPLQRTLFAGDDMRDLQAGRAAGTMTAVVHYGYGSHDPGDALVADSVQVHHPRDLVELVRRQNAC